MLDKCLPKNQSGHIKHIKQSNKLSRGGDEEALRLSGEEVSETFPAFSDSVRGVCGGGEHAEEATRLSFGRSFNRFFFYFFEQVFNVVLSRVKVLRGSGFRCSCADCGCALRHNPAQHNTENLIHTGP